MKKVYRIKKKEKPKSNWLMMSMSILTSASIFGVILMCYDIPSLSNLETSTRRSSVTFEACDGTVIATYGDLFKKMVTVDELPPHVYQSIISIEDKRFFDHCGIDFIGIARALYSNIVQKKVVQGGSSITQQLAKNIFLTPSRSIKRKIQELVLSLLIEKKFTKKQILTIYLNRVYFGSGAYGIDAAAFRLFGKKAKDLKLYESAKLAACLKSPTTYSPINNPDKSDERTLLVLNAMYDCKFISKDDLNKCVLELESGYFVSDIMSDNRYFTDWIFDQLPNICTTNEDIIVRTTLDTKMQANAIVTIRKKLLQKGAKNNVGQMALLTMDRTGAIKAMVGGHTYSKSQYNRCLAKRSPGSAFKFFVYLAALEQGYKPSDKISDAAIQIGHWSPKNYHWPSRGEISITDAFAHSVNTCAVRLAKEIGQKSIEKLAQRLGYESQIPNDMTMALGSGGTTLLEMVKCYTCIIADGNKIMPYGIVNIKTKDGKIIYRNRRIVENVVNKDVCDKMKTLMRAVVKYGTGKRSSVTVASYGKSGTSNNSNDAWFIGFYDNLTTGIWVGNDNNRPMNQSITGGSLPAETWKAYCQSIIWENDLSNEISSLEIKDNDTKKQESLRDFVSKLGK